MKSLLVLALVCTTAFSAEFYSDAEAAKHDGEKAEVRGKVMDVHVADSGMVLLNFGAKFPAQTFTAVIFKDKAAQFSEPEKLKGAQLAVVGTIRIHKDKAEMTLDSPAQLKVLTAAEPAPAGSAEAAAPPEQSTGTVVGPDGVSRRILPFSRSLPAAPQ